MASKLTAAPKLVWTACEAVHEGYYVRHYVSEAIDTGVRDEKGRSIGTRACIDERREGEWKGCIFEPSDAPNYFTVETRALRNDAVFGAIPRNTRADTLEEAKALAEKKVADVIKRRVREAQKGAA